MSSTGELVHQVYLLDQVNAGQQVHSKVNELPVYAFPGVLLLLQHKHVVVEELLEFLVCEVNAKLLKPIELRNSKCASI